MSTTTHPFTPEEVMAFVDGELSADCAQSLSAHLDECAECSMLATELRGLSQKLASWRVEVAPKRLEERVEVAAAESGTKIEPMLGSVVHRRRPALRFTVQLASAIAAILLVMALAIPNLLRSRMAANEASAVGSLRTLNTAAATYSGTYGHYPPSLKSFGSSPSGVPSEDAAGLIDPILAEGGPRSGYVFTYRRTLGEVGGSRQGYEVRADPFEPGKSGQRHFSSDQTGGILADGLALDSPGSLGQSRSAGDRVAGGQDSAKELSTATPMIARAAELKLVVDKLDGAREAMDRILAHHKGYVGHLSASSEAGSARTVTASLRVPAEQLDACLVELKKLGRVTQESQAGEEVTQQHLDLVARLKNSRNTEARLNDVLKQRSGPIKEILDVEKESARVRGEIEQMEAEQQTLQHRVEFGTIDLTLVEEYQAQLNPAAPSAGMQIRNATIDGFRNASESLLSLVLFFAEAGPSLLLWSTILGFPCWLVWRRYRRFRVAGVSLGV